ncbi:MAG: NF038132 family protein [Bryobacteraceae bacterium]
MVAAALIAALVYGPGSAAAQTPKAGESARRAAAGARLRSLAAPHARAPIGGPTDPSSVPSGWTCVGNCGTDVADGSVTLSPTGNSSYEWVSTNGGTNGVGALPTGALGSETDGSTLATPVFTAAAGAPLTFYFNYVTSDGAGFADYAWAELFNSANNPAALLFTARTAASGSIVPGSGMPAPLATLTPPSVPIIGGAPTWSPLGVYSGQCWAAGCGYTGWVKSSYTIPAAGNYYLKVGVVNWLDTEYDSGLAVDGVTVNGVPVATTPVPSSLVLAMLGLAALGMLLASRKFVRS